MGEKSDDCQAIFNSSIHDHVECFSNWEPFSFVGFLILEFVLHIEFGADEKMGWTQRCIDSLVVLKKG